MNKSAFISRGMYFEEFEIGQRIVSPARTVTEADVVNFAGVSGDFGSIHTDAEYAKSTPFGQRVVYGLLGMSIASGLAVRSGVLEGTVIAFREIDNWKFSQPLFIDDTIHVEIEVEGTKLIPRLGGGMLTLGLKVINQDDQTVMKGQWIVIVESKTANE